MAGIRELVIAARRYQAKGVLSKALVVSGLNQAVSSGTNFVLGVCLVRMLSPSEFGLYGIGFAISLFYAGIGNALFLTQMVVHAPDKSPEERRPYAGRILLLELSFCALTASLGVVMLLAGGLLWDSMARHTMFALSVMAASVAHLLKEFFTGHAYNVRKEPWALSIHCVVAVVTVVLLWAQYRFVGSPDAAIALLVYATAQASGALLGFGVSRLPVFHSLAALIETLREVFCGGKWAGIAGVVCFARIQVYTIVVASLMGPVGVAKLNASRLLVVPATMLTPALGQVAMPRLAGLRQRGEFQLQRLGLAVAFVLLTVAVTYNTILLCGYDMIVNRVWGDKYGGLFALTALWSLYTCLLALRNGMEMIGQILKKFKNLSRINAYSAIISLVATYLLTINHGLPGALVGLIIGEITQLWLIHNMLRQSPAMQRPVAGFFGNPDEN
ncbi:MAG: Polysaccharide biosynthesis protein [Syntrophorhabdus sp. PtaB.Bin047]|nr:MAG: Polysaccharide biosynthesis protein [Syntrophorhabdus sp. PtaB.Bin047]